MKSKQDLSLAFHSKDFIRRISLQDEDENDNDENDEDGDEDDDDDDKDLDKNHEGSFLATTFPGSRSLARNMPWVIFAIIIIRLLIFVGEWSQHFHIIKIDFEGKPTLSSTLH